MSAMRYLPLLFVTACVAHEDTPGTLPRDARGGIAPDHFDVARACTDWNSPRSHVSYPELDRARSCFVPVTHDRERVTYGEVPAGCGFRPSDAKATIEAEAERDERIARGEDAPLPLELACKLDGGLRRAAAAHNARTLRAIATDDHVYPYAAIEAFGFGHWSHVGTKLDAWRPEAVCASASDVNIQRFSVNVDRASRAALAWAGHVAPVVVVSGGAVHSALVEAFLLDFIATCRVGMPSDRVLLDPCADHTHTNVRNAGRVVAAIGGRTSYIVTDDSFQAIYLQEHTLFDAFGGSVDQRALRDFHHLIGSWRQASIGMDAGFWYTPYRFWADPNPRLRDFTCDK
jgi:hypothetical protein